MTRQQSQRLLVLVLILAGVGALALSGPGAPAENLRGPGASPGLIHRYVYDRTDTYSNYPLGWHPSFSQSYYASGYRIDLGALDDFYRLGLRPGPVPSLFPIYFRVTVGGQSFGTASAFVFIKADDTRQSRPWVYAQSMEVAVYDIHVLHPVTGELLYVHDDSYYELRDIDTEIQIKYETSAA